MNIFLLIHLFMVLREQIYHDQNRGGTVAVRGSGSGNRVKCWLLKTVGSKCGPRRTVPNAWSGSMWFRPITSGWLGIAGKKAAFKLPEVGKGGWRVVRLRCRYRACIKHRGMVSIVC